MNEKEINNLCDNVRLLLTESVCEECGLKMCDNCTHNVEFDNEQVIF